MRRSHYIKPNHGNELPTDCIWIDTETNAVKLNASAEKHVLDFGFAAYRRTYGKDKWTKPDWKRFTGIEEIWSWIFSKLHGKIKLYIFAHNWGYDAPVLDLFNVLPKHGWKLISAVIDSPPVILKYRKQGNTICVVDTLNIWKVPLSVIGKGLGLPKLEMPSKTATTQEWDAYGKRDTEIIMDATMQWFAFLRDNDLGGFAPTISAQALRTFRHRFMKHKILCDDNEPALALSRSAFFGGRTECFYIGKVKDRIYKLDINSMYPAVMKTLNVPIKLCGIYSRESLDDLALLLDNYCCVADVEIETDVPAYPFVLNKRLVFPVGSFRVSLNTPELSFALERGHIKKIHKVAIYERAAIFTDYVNYFFDKRLEYEKNDDAAGADRCKRMGNHLFGKFGQNGRVFEIVDQCNDLTVRAWIEVDAETNEVHKMRQYGGIIEQFKDEGESRDSMPAISGHITSAARIRLWRDIELAGPENVYYTDTDSLWLNQKGFNKIYDPDKSRDFGEYKIEGVHDEVTINGLKDYTIDGLTKIKGIKQKALETEPNVFQQEQFSSLVGLVRAGDLSAPRIKVMTKRLTRRYTKGVKTESGKVLPIRLTDGILTTDK